MKRFWLLLAFLLWSASAADAQFAASGMSIAPSTCPKGTQWADGCVGAPLGLMFDTGLFTTDLQSGQTLTLLPPYNVAGYHFGLGHTSNPATMQDPATASITGCTYVPFSTTKPSIAGTDGLSTATDPTLGPGYPAMYYCKATAGTGPISIPGMNFGAIGTHGCTIFYPSEGSTQDFTLSNIYLELTAECSTNLTGGGYGGHPTIFGNSGANTVNMTITSFTIIGHAYDACCTYTGTGAATAGSPPYKNNSAFIIGFHTTKAFTIRYPWFQELPGQPIAQAGTTAGGAAEYDYVYFRDFQRSVAQGHGEPVNSGLMTSQTFRNWVVVGTAKNGAVWDAVMNLGNGNGGPTTTTTGTNSSGQNLLNVALTTGVAVGQAVSQTGNPPLTVSAVTTGQVTLSGNLPSTLSPGTTINFSYITGTTKIDGLVAVINGVGGASGSAMFPAATGHMTGGVYTLDSGGPLYPGGGLNGGANFQGIGTHALLSGTGGVGSTYSMDCGLGLNNVTCPSSLSGSYLADTPHGAAVTGGSLSGTTETLNTTGTFVTGQVIPVTGITPSDWNIASATVTSAVAGTSVTFTNTSASSPTYTSGGTIGGGTVYQTSGQVSNELAANVVDTGHGTQTSIDVRNVYTTLSSIPQGAFEVRSPADTMCINKPTFANNFNMETGAAIASGFTNATGIAANCGP